MVSRALEKYLRISDKKVRPVARLIKGKKVSDALNILFNVNKKGARVLQSVLQSALSNAERITEKKLGSEDLVVSKINVNGGPALKRFRAMSMGRAGMIRKRTSHILVELDKVKAEVKAKAKAKGKK